MTRHTCYSLLTAGALLALTCSCGGTSTKDLPTPEPDSGQDVTADVSNEPAAESGNDVALSDHVEASTPSDSGDGGADVVLDAPADVAPDSPPDGTPGMCSPTGDQPVPLAVGSKTAGFVALDDHYLYWTDSMEAVVQRVPRCGGSTKTLATVEEGGGLEGLVVYDDQVYFAASGNSYAGGFIARVPILGGQMTTVADTQVNPWKLAVEPSGIYWEAENGIFWLALEGGTPTKLAQGSSWAFAVDSDYVYWIEGEESQTARRVSKQGTGLETLGTVETTGLPWCAAVDDTYLYWTNYLGNVLKVKKTGGEVSTVAEEGYHRCLALDNTNVYYTNDGPADQGVYRVAKTGGTGTQLSSMEGVGIALGEHDVFWAGGQGIFRLSK